MRVHIAPNEVSILLLKTLIKMAQESESKRTPIQIQCPYIIKKPVVGPASNDEELGTDQRHGMIVTTARPGTIDHNTGPLSRYWKAINSDQREQVLTIKKVRRTKVEKI